jgi:hypothetical protein
VSWIAHDLSGRISAYIEQLRQARPKRWCLNDGDWKTPSASPFHETLQVRGIGEGFVLFASTSRWEEMGSACHTECHTAHFLPQSFLATWFNRVRVRESAPKVGRFYKQFPKPHTTIRISSLHPEAGQMTRDLTRWAEGW